MDDEAPSQDEEEGAVDPQQQHEDSMNQNFIDVYNANQQEEDEDDSQQHHQHYEQEDEELEYGEELDREGDEYLEGDQVDDDDGGDMVRD